MIDSPALLDAAAALADGAAVDWDSAAQSATSEEERCLLAELRFVEHIARLGVDRSSPSALGVASGSEPVPADNRRPEEFWGPLRLLEHVGRGSFGDVYRAWDTRLDREVALKLLRRSRHDDDARASTVIQEGRLLARVRHPNVVTVYGAERIEGQVGVWMEFIHGKTLEQELREQGPFDIDRATSIGIDLADALATVHRAGLIHGDVKTHNVMCDSDGRIVLTDFGAGFELDETTAEAHERGGTPLCIAPEVFAGRPATPASDVYSLGVLLYHLLTCSYPVRGSSVREIREAHAAGAHTPLALERPNLPPAFVRIVDRALDPDPANRYSSPADLGSELASLRAVDASSNATTRRRAWTIVAVAAVLIVSASLASAPRWFRSGTPAIAVLPFENLSPDPDGVYFVDGLTDEIIRNLSIIDGLDVRSRTSSFMFKGYPRSSLRDIAQQLQVSYVVEGSMLRSEGRLRVNAQLIRATNDVPIWSQSFDREFKDVFAIQDEISRSIVNKLRLTLGRGQRRYTNLDAYDLYLRARAYGSPVDPVQGKVAAELFQQVINRDPSFAPAYAGLADAWAAMSINRAETAVRPDEAFASMKSAAERALQLDPLLAEAHAAMGVVLARERKWADAEASFRRAAELNGNLSSIRLNFVTSTLMSQAKVEESVSQLRTALRRDPLSVDVQARLAYVLVSAGRYEESIAIGRRIVPSAAATNDGLNHARQVLARALFQHGERAEAVQRFEQLGSGSDNFRGYAYAVIGRQAEARALAAQRQNFPASLVLIHAGLGERDRAFEALERMAAEKDPRVGSYLTFPELASLRADPRMGAFRRRLGLPD